MKKMEEIKKMKDGELASLVEANREALRTERFSGAAAGQNKRVLKKEIARALTELQTRSHATREDA